MKPLTDRQMAALKSLDKKTLGTPTVFLNWADADSLVEIGLAETFGTGKYAITKQGLDVLYQRGLRPDDEGLPLTDDERAKRAEAARIEVLESILRFIKEDTSGGLLEIKLADTDEEARADGWPSMTAQYLALSETIRALPVDVARRVKLVPS